MADNALEREILTSDSFRWMKVENTELPETSDKHNNLKKTVEVEY